MNPTLVGTIVFACTFGGVLLGMWLRTTLPEHHLNNESRDTVKLGAGLIATMTALVLGLVTASAKSSFDTMSTAVKTTAVDILTLDRFLARYGSDTREIRVTLQDVIANRVDMIWPEGSSRPTVVDPLGQLRLPRASLTKSALSRRVMTPSERSNPMRWHSSSRCCEPGGSCMPAGADRQSLCHSLWSFDFGSRSHSQASGCLPRETPRSSRRVFVCAMSVGGAVFLIAEMDGPFDGLLKVSAEPLRYTIAHLNQ